MKNFLTQQYTQDKKFKIKHNYLSNQFKDYPKIFKKIEKVINFNDFTLGFEVDKFDWDEISQIPTLSEDIIRYMVRNLDIIHILNFCRCNKYINKALDTLFFQELAIKLYSREFWTKAIARPIICSKPLNIIKKELMRLHYFQDFIKLHNFKVWTIQDFYMYWLTYDTKHSCIFELHSNNILV